MLDMKHTPCFRAAAAWGNFSALHRNILSPLILQFASASNPMLLHSTIAQNGLKQLGNFTGGASLFKCAAVDCK